MKISPTVLIRCFLTFFSVFTNFSQQPMPIDVKSMKLFKQAFWTNAGLTINAAGLSDTSFAAANFGMFGFEHCEPCPMGSSFSTIFCQLILSALSEADKTEMFTFD